MEQGWITITEHIQERGEFTLKVKQQFINGYDNFRWLPQVWAGDCCLCDGNGRTKTTPKEAMDEASELARVLAAKLTLTVYQGRNVPHSF